MKSDENDNFMACSRVDQYGTIQCGDFLSSKDQLVHTITFEMMCKPELSGIGFITDEFSKWDHKQSADKWNLMDAHSMWLAGNGFYRTSKVFAHDMKDSCSFIKYEWFSEGDQVSVRINTKTRSAVIWNNDVDIDNLRGDESNYVFFLDLPLNDTRVALSLFMGDVSQTARIVTQHVEFHN